MEKLNKPEPACAGGKSRKAENRSDIRGGRCVYRR